MNSEEDMKMRQFETTTNCSLFASATQEELLVSEILLGLENVIPLPIFNWGSRKRRSCLDEFPGAPPSLQIAEEDIEVRRPLVEAEEDAAAATTPSPVTPFSFSPSESDGNLKRSSVKNSKKRSIVECVDMMEELTDGDLLRVKVENARKQYNEFKTRNSDLKAKAIKQESLKARQREEEDSQRDMGRFLNLGMDFTQPDETIMVSHRQPFVADQTANKIHDPFGPIEPQMYPPNINGLESVNSVGPAGIPDLNVTAEEAFEDSIQPLDVNLENAVRRARCAEARRTRKALITLKSTRSACGIKLPTTRC